MTCDQEGKNVMLRDRETLQASHQQYECRYLVYLIFSIDEIQRLPEKPVGPSQTSVKCLKSPNKINPDLWFKLRKMCADLAGHNICMKNEVRQLAYLEVSLLLNAAGFWVCRSQFVFWFRVWILFVQGMHLLHVEKGVWICACYDNFFLLVQTDSLHLCEHIS